MENYYLFEFYKERDLGSIINDTFVFIRENWRDMLSKSWKVLLPYFLIVVGFSLYFLVSIGDFFTNIFLIGIRENPVGIMLNVLIYILIIILFYVIAELTILNYIKLYIAGEGYVDEDELKKSVYKKVLPLFFLHFIIIIMTYIGFMFLLLPGIYLSIVLIFAPFIYVYEDKSIVESITGSFSLTSGKWWVTFGTLIIMSIVFSILGYVFSLPAFFYQMIVPFTNDNPTGMEVFSVLKDPLFLLFSLISIVGRYLISVMSLVGMSLVYFDLYEQKTSRGIVNKINELGSEI